MKAVGIKFIFSEPIPLGNVICCVKPELSSVINTLISGLFSPNTVETIWEFDPDTNCTLLYRSVFIKNDLFSFFTEAAFAIIDISKPPNGLASAVLNQLEFILYINPFVPGAK